MGESLAEMVAIDADGSIRELHAAARRAGDAWAVHRRACRACRAGVACLTRRRLDDAANRAEDRLDAALERR